ncbi:MAG: 50S ribosomal protein L11 methyltransferase [Legionellales bacterium]|nr:50S ribosomal protein L11 methyltransferase [Legionellales bacterium]
MDLVEYIFTIKEGQHFDAVSDVLFEKGAISIGATDAEDTPVFATNEITHPVWNDITINAIFEKDTLLVETLRNVITEIIGYTPKDNVNKLIQQDWHKKWQSETSPCVINSKLAIYPSHVSAPDTSQKIINLDPGLAFGTGSHPTTKMCLEWLSENHINGLEVIDYGCGSGILAIAAILFNAKSVTAIDNDEQAIFATKMNCKKNNILPYQIQTCSPEQLSDKKVDLIIANIYLNVLIDLRSIIEKHLKIDGQVLFSGALLEQSGKLIDKYANFSIIEKHNDKEWAMIVAKKVN